MRTFSNMLKSGSLDRVGVINAILSSPEFTSRLASLPGIKATRHAEVCDRRRRPYLAAFKNTGARDAPDLSRISSEALTDVRFVAGIDSLSGIVEGYPIPGNFHGDTLEWIGTLRSALDARNSFTMLELGAGWAPWCVIGYIAAKQLGIEKIKVIGVEGDAGHIDFIRETFAANGIGPDVGEAIHGVVGLTDGKAFFPKASDASRVYGGSCCLLGGGKSGGRIRGLLGISISARGSGGASTLLQPGDVDAANSIKIDLIHCDIQGAEANLFSNVIDLVSAKVKRLVIGTHSFEIDRQLACLFPKYGWDLEGFDGCRVREDSGKCLRGPRWRAGMEEHTVAE